MRLDKFPIAVLMCDGNIKSEANSRYRCFMPRLLLPNVPDLFLELSSESSRKLGASFAGNFKELPYRIFHTFDRTVYAKSSILRKTADHREVACNDKRLVRLRRIEEFRGSRDDELHNAAVDSCFLSTFSLCCIFLSHKLKQTEFISEIKPQMLMHFLGCCCPNIEDFLPS